MVRYSALIMLVMAGAFAVLTALGMVHAYNPAPYWDMWTGYLEFYIRAAEEGGWTPWWELHNEHRIVLAKVLFAIDLKFFDGSMAFLFVLNWLFAASYWLLFGYVLSALFPGQFQTPAIRLTWGLLGVLIFSWLQRENFTWAFQSQFFMAYLLPFLAFVGLARARLQGSMVSLIIAAVLGVLSAGTMVNGVLVLPLMVVMALCMRMGAGVVIGLALLALLTVGGYYYDYHTPEAHVSAQEGLLRYAPAALLYFLIYLGGPWYFVFQGASMIIPAVAGALLILCSAYLAYRVLRFPRDDAPMQFALLALLLYVGGTALGTAGGRVEFGIEHALTSRYMTPVILGWCALLVLVVRHGGARVYGSGRCMLALLIPLTLLQSQWSAPTALTNVREQMIGTLALAMGARDEQFTGQVYFEPERAAQIAQAAFARNLSIFANPAVGGVARQIGDVITLTSTRTCTGYVDSITPLEGDSPFVRVQGWVFEPESARVPERLLLINEQNRVVGAAVVGQQRFDVAAALGESARHSGFTGYVQAEHAKAPLILIGRDPDCHRAAGP